MPGSKPSLLVIAVGLAACHLPAEETSFVAVPPGKADNYLSPVVQEYDVEAEASVKLTEEEALLDSAARTTRAAELATALTGRITQAMDAELSALAPEGQSRDPDGVIVFLRKSSVQTDELTPVDAASYTFVYRAEVAGTNNLLPFPDGTRQLEVTVEETPLTLRFRPSARVSDTYPRYRDLFQGGLEIYLHYGGDYNDSRWDLKKSRAMFDKLQALGLKPPVPTYDDLKLDSGPFVGELDVLGQPVKVAVTMVHPEMVPDEELDRLIDAYKTNAARADVVIYSGHASEDPGYSGVVVHYNPRRALPATELKNIELPERYQVFVFSGCHTYTGYADQLLANPKKTADTVDVITAVSTTPLSRDIVHAFLAGLLDQTQGTWFPHSWSALLSMVNKESERSWRGGFGVHGLEGNPKISPLADPKTLGADCSTSEECPGIDNLCVRSLLGVSRRCGAACTDSAGCPAGFGCWWSFASGFTPVRQCVPTS